MPEPCPTPEPPEPPATARLPRRDVAAALAVGLISLLAMAFDGWTAYAWPSIDNFPYFESVQQGNGLEQHDFFTAASVAPNPRMVFTGSVLAVADLFGVHYYRVAFALRVVTTVLTPLLLTLVLLQVLRRRGAAGWLPVAAVGAAVLGMALVYTHRFAMASWQSLYLEASAQAASQLIGLVALALLAARFRDDAPMPVWSGTIPLAIATALHPVNGFCLSLFWCLICMRPDRTWLLRSLLLGTAAFLVPTAVVAISFHSELELDAAAFAELYAHRLQPYHYDVPFLLGQTKNQGLFAVILVLSAGAWWWLRRCGRPAAAWRAAALGALLIGIVGGQYLFTDLVPVTKVLMFGPTRVLLVVPWLATAVAIECLAARGHASDEDGAWPWWPAPAAALPVALLIGAVGADRPLDGQGDDRRALYRWLRDHTEPHEVVACTDRMLACSIRHFARRPVFMATNFPFNPAYIADFGQRLELQDALEDAADADSISQLSDRYGVRVILAPTADLPASEVVEGVAVGPLHLHRVAAEPAP